MNGITHRNIDGLQSSGVTRMLQVVLLQLIVLSTVVSCPDMCRCNQDEIRCEGLQKANFSFTMELCPKAFVIVDSNLTEIKSFELQDCSEQLKHLHIIHCGIFEIYPKAFAKFTNLYWLNMEGNLIHFLNPGLFKDLKYLEVLEIENNAIQSIKIGAFIGLEQITTLSLSNNMLSVLDEIFDPLLNLKQLELTNNQLENIKPKYFMGLFNLNKLYLNGNKIDNLQTNAFVHDCNNICHEKQYETPLQRLQFLYLQDNLIENIESNAFEGLKNVAFLNLNNNKIHKLHLNSFHGLVKLFRLQLENCSIKELSTGTFMGLSELRELYMGKNDFFTLSPKYFEGLLKLKLLKVSDYIYHIQHNVFSTTPNLINLNLDNNELEGLPLNVTKDLTKLEMLSLSKNRIQVLENYMFKYLSNLKVLKLDENSIHTIHDNAFSGLNHLQKLSLRNNNICTLSNDTPIAYYSPKSFRKPFMKLEELTHLDLSGNCLKNLAISVFTYLPRLHFLNLGNNDIAEVEESVIMNTEALKELVLHDNPLDCNCKLMKIRKWLLRHNINTSVTFGHEPRCETGMEWDQVFKTLSCVRNGKEARFLKNFALFMIGPAAIVVIGLLSWGYTKLKKKPRRSKT